MLHTPARVAGARLNFAALYPHRSGSHLDTQMPHPYLQRAPWQGSPAAAQATEKGINPLDQY